MMAMYTSNTTHKDVQEQTQTYSLIKEDWPSTSPRFSADAWSGRYDVL